jgi:hypothetical protein
MVIKAARSNAVPKIDRFAMGPLLGRLALSALGPYCEKQPEKPARQPPFLRFLKTLSVDGNLNRDCNRASHRTSVRSAVTGGVYNRAQIEIGCFPKGDNVTASSPHEVTHLLLAWRSGDAAVLYQLIPLVYAAILSPEPDENLIALDGALNALAAFDPRKAKVVELRFFGGMTQEETAEALGISSDTVLRDWKLAKLWLWREMRQAADK